MPINILMPALSPTMEKGNLAKWLKKEGDKVKSGDVIAEIETDKATMEVEAVDEGTLAKIVVPEGTADVPVNQVIAVLAGEGEDVKAAAASAGKARACAEAARPLRCRLLQRRSPRPRRRKPAVQQPRRAAPAQAAPAPQLSGKAANRMFASPLARRLAKEAGIDCRRIAGLRPARPRHRARRGRREIRQGPASRGRRAGGGAAAPAIAPSMSDQQVRALFEEGSYEVVPHDGMRRTIAQRLTQSTQTIPHFYLTIDCNIGKLLAAREEINAAAPKDKDGKPAYKLSVNDFVIKALALALQRIPDANVSWTEGGMLKHKHSDIGVAVAMPGGLITPIIRKAESKSLSTISNEMKDFAARARAPQAQAGRIPGRHHGGVEPRHVRHQGLHRGDQSAARHHPCGRRRRGAGDREERQDRGRARHERDAVLRSPRGRRRARRRADRRVQDADRKSGDDGGVRCAPLSAQMADRVAGTRNDEALMA